MFSEMPLLESMGLFERRVYREVLLFENFSTKFPQKGQSCQPCNMTDKLLTGT